MRCCNYWPTSSAQLNVSVSEKEVNTIKEWNGMLKKFQVCAFKFVHPQKLSWSVEGIVLSLCQLGTGSASCFCLWWTWWELEGGRENTYWHTRWQVPWSWQGFDASTQTGCPGLFRSVKVTVWIPLPCHFVRGRLFLDDILKPFTFCVASRALMGWKPNILVCFPQRKSHVQIQGQFMRPDGWLWKVGPNGMQLMWQNTPSLLTFL